MENPCDLCQHSHPSVQIARHTTHRAALPLSEQCSFHVLKHPLCTLLPQPSLHQVKPCTRLSSSSSSSSRSCIISLQMWHSLSIALLLTCRAAQPPVHSQSSTHFFRHMQHVTVLLPASRSLRHDSKHALCTVLPQPDRHQTSSEGSHSERRPSS